MPPHNSPTNVVQLRTHRPFVVHEGPKPDYVKWLTELAQPSRPDRPHPDVHSAVRGADEPPPALPRHGADLQLHRLPDYSPLDSFGDEHPEPVHWPSLCAGMVLGVAAGLLAIAVPAIVLARVVYGAWL